MLKFIFFTLSLFSFSFSDNDTFNDYYIEKDYQLVTQETDDLKDVIYYQDNIYIKDLDNNIFNLYLKGYSFEIEASILNGYLDKDIFYLFKYYNNELTLQKYYFDGTFEDEVLIYQGTITSDLFIVQIGNSLCCGFTEFFNEQYNINLIDIYESENNLFIEEHFFGGDKNEKLLGLESNQEELFLIVQKDHITESCFGNGGSDDCHVLAKVKDYQVCEYITINSKERLNAFCLRNDYLYCILNNKLYLFNLKLELLNIKEFNEFLDVFIGYNQNMTLIYSDKIEIYDCITLNKKSDFIISNIKNYRQFNNSLYCEYQDNFYLFDIIDYTKTIFIEEYVYEYEDEIMKKMQKVSSLFGECEFIEMNYLEYYQRNLFGNYHIKLQYQTVGGIDIFKEVNQEVPLQININDNGIYPNGYRIIFNGEGYLDGNLIVSNHQVKNDGKHTLVIKGANTQKEFNFYISKNQYEYQDKFNELEIKNVKVNEDYRLKYILNEEIEIEDISIIGGEIKDYTVNNLELEIVISGFDEVGLHKIIIERIKYKKDYYTDYIYLNKVINLNVYLKGISFGDILLNEDCSCELEYIDLYQQGRYIEFRFLNKTKDYIYTFPIGTQNIDIQGIENGEYQMIVSLCYDDSCCQLVSQRIYDMAVTIDKDISLGAIKLFNQDSNYKLKIDINKDFKENNVLELKHNGDVIYSYQEFKKESLISYCSIFFIVFILLGICLRFLYYRKKKV